MGIKTTPKRSTFILVRVLKSSERSRELMNAVFNFPAKLEKDVASFERHPLWEGHPAALYPPHS